MGLAPCRDGVSPTFVGSRAGALPPPQHKVLPHTHRSSLLPHRSTCKTQQNQRTPDGNRRCESKASEGSEMLNKRPALAAALRSPRCPPLSISHPPMVPPHHAHTVGSARSWEGRAEGSVDPRSCARCSGGSPSRAVRSQLEAFWNEAGGSPCPAAPRSGPRRPSDPLLAGTSPVVAITKWKETLWILPCFRSDWSLPAERCFLAVLLSWDPRVLCWVSCIRGPSGARRALLQVWNICSNAGQGGGPDLLLVTRHSEAQPTPQPHTCWCWGCWGVHLPPFWVSWSDQ